MNELTRQAAREAFYIEFKTYPEIVMTAVNSEQRSEHQILIASTYTYWLRAWELATQAAYERAAQECENTPVFADLMMDARVKTKNDCALNVRALANESSGKGEKG